MDQKTVFISYRRSTSKHLARSIYLDLKQHGWDVFLDVTTIDSGDFDRIILNQIGARAHFILLVSPGALERCAQPGDWLRREVEEAVRLERNIVPIIEEGADFAREAGYLPTRLRKIVEKKNGLPLPHYFFDAAMEMLRTRFLKAPEYVRIHTTPPEEQAEVQRRLRAMETGAPASARGVQALLPAPFSWVDIPAGKVKLKVGGYLKADTTFDVPAFSIARYPVTNAQFAKFVEAGGYRERQWWTEAGWEAREKGWTAPRYWTDSKWNGADQPVVGVSWYEAVAFCKWLSATTGERIMLPTEGQWQRAAQGDDRRAYPWGNEWDCKRCNNSVEPCKSEVTTPVTRYEGEQKGDSFFGVTDMAGNVWEWCLTTYKTGSESLEGEDARVLHGGSWYLNGVGRFRCDYRYRLFPQGRNDDGGFRISRS